MPCVKRKKREIEIIQFLEYVISLAQSYEIRETGRERKRER